MSSDNNAFTWRPHEARGSRSRHALLLLLVLFAALCALLANVYPAREPTRMSQRPRAPTQLQAQTYASVPKAEIEPGATAGNGLRHSQSPPSRPPADRRHERQGEPQAASHPVLLNPGSAGPAASDAERKPARIAQSRPDPQQRTARRSDTPSRQRIARSAAPVARNAMRHARLPRGRDKNVLVVVRRTGPPYDTKVLRGRIRDGRLVVNRQDRRGMTLLY